MKHRWEYFDAASVGDGPEDRSVPLPPRRACVICGVTEIFARDLTDYPHVAVAIAESPEKVRLA